MREYFCSIWLAYFFCLDITSIVLRQILLSFIFLCSSVKKKITKKIDKNVSWFSLFIGLNLVWGIFILLLLLRYYSFHFSYHLSEEFQTRHYLAIKCVLRHSETNITSDETRNSRTKLKLQFISDWKSFNTWLYFKWYIPSRFRLTTHSISVLLVNCYAHWTLSLTVILDI